jgi:hypothetical protein
MAYQPAIMKSGISKWQRKAGNISEMSAAA